MLVIANNILRDSIYGMVFRVSVGAALSSIDAVTDIYVITKYYSNKDLRAQANSMLAMISVNMIIQLLIVMGQYKKKSWNVKLKEMAITLLFLRPAVDAYRVSTNHDDDEATFNPMIEMIMNKVRPLRGSRCNVELIY